MKNNNGLLFNGASVKSLMLYFIELAGDKYY